MSLQKITGQEHVKAQIAAWLTGDCLPQTILVTGREGVGKRELAFALACIINCHGQENDACGECSSCVKIATLSHRDVHVLLPLTSGGNRNDEGAMSAMREAALEYIDKNLSLSHSNSNIAIDHIRLLHREMSYAPAEGRRKIAILLEADCMMPAGANSLLKILEEPPRHAVFIIVSSAPDRLLPTVLSRCQRLDLRPVSIAALTARLLERGVDADRARLAARVGAGSVRSAEAVVYQAEQFEERRRRVERFLAAGFSNEDSTYWLTLEELGGRGERGQVEDFLQMCGEYLRDLFMLAGGRNADVTNVDRLPWLENQMLKLDADAIEQTAGKLDRAYADLYLNINVQLLLADFWRALRSCTTRA